MILDNKCELPLYLNKDFFRTALEEGLREKEVEIKKVVIDETTGGGENYCSKIYRAKVLYRSGSYHLDKEEALVIKCITITPATQFLEELAVFLKEKIFYYDVLGKLEILIGGNCKFGAKCFFITKDPVQTIVFDDLARYGYKLANRQRGLNEEHCVIILKKLAKFHAASMVLIERDSEIKKHFLTGMLDENYIRTSKRFIDFMTLLLRTLADLVATWEGYKMIAKKLHEHCDHLIENLVKTGRENPNEIKVLNHGDLWINNFMFKYDVIQPEMPVDALFVDFQNSFFGSPGCDINFFLNSSVQLEVLINRRNFLIETYYESFRDSLKLMHYNHIPTYDDIKTEITSRELYGFFSSYAFLPMVAMKKEDSEDNSIEAFSNKEFATKKVKLMFTSNTRTIETLKYVLKRFYELKVFD